MIIKKDVEHYTDDRGSLYWASNKLLDFEYKYLTMSTIKPGCTRGGHYHKRVSEKLLVLVGELLFILEDEEMLVQQGEIVDIPSNKMHTVVNNTDTTAVFIEFKSEEYDKNDPDTHVR